MSMQKYSKYLNSRLLPSPMRHLFDKPLFWVFAICLSQILCVPAANAGPSAPAMTVSPGGTASNNTGIAQDNSTTPKDTRDGYFKRNPRALWAHQMDSTQKITGSNLGGNTNTQTGTDSVPDKTDSLDNEPTSPTSSNSNQVNALKSTGPGYGGYEAYTLIPPDPYCPLAYWQPEFVNFVTTLSARDAEMFKMPITTFGYPISDTQFQIIDRENKQRFIELLCDPERVMWVSNAIGQMSKGYVGNALANLGQKQFGDAANRIVGGDSGNADVGTGGAGLGGNLGGFSIGALANIANENLQWAGASSPYWTSLQAIAMVQIMYKEVFIPMAILLLLPGALITQFRAMIAHNFNLQTDEAGSPFVGILRAMIALFLIPSTQLIVSYSIDVGNSLAYSVAQWVNLQIVLQWSNELAYDPPPSMMDNAILPPQGGNGTGTGNGSGSSGGMGGLGSLLGGSGGSSLFSGLGLPSFISNFLGQLLGNFLNIPDTGEGLGSGQPSQQVHLEEQSFLSGSLQIIFNLASTIFSIMLMVLTAFQLVYMCYLYLMGPLAAAFYAWPQLSQNMFKSIFTNWVQAVINLALWRFWWMLILAIMTQRMIFIQNHGETLNLQWEIAVFTCFVGLMFYVPTSPWQFQAGQAYTSVIAAGSSIVGGAGGKGGGMAGLAAEEMKAGGASDAQVSQMTNAVYGVTSSMYNIGMQAEQLQTEGTARGAALNASQGSPGGGESTGTPAPPLQTNNNQTTVNNPGGVQGTNPVPLTGATNQNNQANAGNQGGNTNNSGVPNYQTPSNGQSRTGNGQGGIQVNQNVSSNPTAIANAQTQVNRGGGQQTQGAAPPPPPPPQSSPSAPPPPPPPPTPPPPPPLSPPPQSPPPPPQGNPTP